MRCLVVGGTGFLGGAMADALVERGHEVTVLSRGRATRSSQSGVKCIEADRYGDLAVLKDEEFEWVFDSCAFSPDAVERLLKAVGASLKRYVMISSLSTYGVFRKPSLSEAEEVRDTTDEDLQVAANVLPESRCSAIAYGASYGRLKRACELKAEQMIEDRAIALRAGLLVGVGDYTDRLTWWVRRIDEAREDRVKVPAPAPEHRLVQLIDVRDIAEFAVNAASEGLSGLWNVTGEPQAFTGILNHIKDVSGSDAELVWVEEGAIRDAGVTPWVDMPMMAPLGPDYEYFHEVSTAKAQSAGLRCRPLVDTLRPLLDWDRSRRDLNLKIGMTEEQEALLLA